MSNTSSSSIPKDVLNQRIESFATAIGLPVEKVRTVLKEKGIDDSTDESVERSLALLENREFLTFGDLCESFSDTKLVAKPVLRYGMPYLVGSPNIPQEKTTEEKLTETLSELAANSRTPDKMSGRALLERYAEREPKIAKELSFRSHGRPCIVFIDDDSVDVETSLKLLKLCKTQPISSQYHPVGDELKKVYRPGQWPEQMLEECPFHPGEYLVNGYCEKSDTDWTGASEEARVFVRVLITNAKKNIPELLYPEIHKNAKQGLEHLKSVYRKPAAVYKELADADNLPKLKSKPGQASRTDTAGM